MLSFDQTKTEVCQKVLPEFLQTALTFQTRESAQAPTLDFINKIAEMLLSGSISYNEPQDFKKLEEKTDLSGLNKTEEFFLKKVTTTAVKV